MASADSVSIRHVRTPEGARRRDGLDGPLEPNVSTRLESSPTSHAVLSRPGRRSSFPVDSRHPSPASFRRPEGLRRSACSRHALSDIPNRRERSSLSLTRRLARLSSALTPVIVSIPRSAIPRARAPVPPPRRATLLPVPEMFLSRGSSVLSYDSVSLSRHASTFASARSQRASHPLPNSPSFNVTLSEGSGELGHLRLTAIRTHRSHGSRSECPLRRDAERRRPRSSSTNVSNPRFNFQSWVTPRLGSLRFAYPSRHGGSRSTPFRASLGEHVRSSKALSTLAASTCVPSMLRHPRDPRQNARVGGTRPSSAIIASTGVARDRTPKCANLGAPPDGLDRIRWGRVNATSS